MPSRRIRTKFKLTCKRRTDVTGFRYLPNPLFKAGRVAEYEFYVSTDGTNWGAAVAMGAFPDDLTAAEREVLFPAKTGRYVRFRAITGIVDAFGFATVAELNVLRAAAVPNQAPSATVTSPTQNLTIPVGSAVTLSGSGSDPDGHVPLTYRWSVGNNSGVTDATVPAPGVVHFTRPGDYVLTFTVGDTLGATAVVTRAITVQAGTLVSPAGWTTTFVDSEDPAHPAAHAIDGNPNTFWSTQSTAPLPHELRVNLGSIRSINGLRYLPRQDGSTVGVVSKYALYVRADGTDWGAPVATGTLQTNGASEKQVDFVGKVGQYVRFQAFAAASGSPTTTVGELRLLETQCSIPSVRLQQPRSLHLQSPGPLEVIADACVAPGQGVRLAVDGGLANGGTEVDVYGVPFAGTVTNLANGEHVVEAFVIDGAGMPIIGDAAYDVANPVGIGELLVGLGDGMTTGFGDDKTDDDSSQDGRNLTTGYTPVLSDLLTTARGYPVAVANEGVGGTNSTHGLALLPFLMAKYHTAQRFLICFGHNDFLQNPPSGRPSGLGLQPGQPGYANSFKHIAQQMIDMLKANGKGAAFCRAIDVQPNGSAVDLAVQEYNEVAAELHADPLNEIPGPPPDFHTYFSSHPEEHADAFLLTGIGYVHLAELWFDSLEP